MKIQILAKNHTALKALAKQLKFTEFIDNHGPRECGKFQADHTFHSYCIQ